MTMSVPAVRVAAEPLDVGALVASIDRPECGAIATFSGVVRGVTDGARTTHLEYEAYVPMAEAKLAELAERARADFDVAEVIVHHRTGRLNVGEASVVVVVASAHRRPALDACAWMIETLKTEVPIWKKEFRPDGSFWVEGRRE